MKIIFIAGPYTGDGSFDSIERNIREAEKYQIALANRRVGFFCPHNHTGHFDSKEGVSVPIDFYYELDMHFLKKIADAMLVIPGWEQSWGAKREVEWAQGNGMKIFFPNSPNDMKEIAKWAIG